MNINHHVIRLRPDRLDTQLPEIHVGLYCSAFLKVLNVPSDVTAPEVVITPSGGSSYKVSVEADGSVYIPPGMLDAAGDGTYHIWATDAHGNQTPLGSGPLAVATYPDGARPSGASGTVVPVSSVMDANGVARQLLAVQDEYGTWTLTVGDVVGSASLVDPSALPADATDADSLAAVKAKLNAIKAALKATCIAFALALATVCNATPLNDIPGTNEVYTAGETDAAITGTVTRAYVESLGISGGGGTDGAAVTNIVTGITDPITNRLAAAEKTVSEWSTYWDGDDVRVTITTFESQTGKIPSLYIEQRTNETSQATNLFRTIWREMAHWESFLGCGWNWYDATWPGFANWSESLEASLDQKADRAWGYYDSHTGGYAPAGYTSISSSNILIAAGMSYQKTVTSAAEVWVLTATEPYAVAGVPSNGVFRITDGEGNVQFETVRGDKVTVAAQAFATACTNGTLYVTYNIEADAHPTVEVCLDLGAADWQAETASACPATVTWTGASGHWVAAIEPTATTVCLFAKATYETGGESYVRVGTAMRLNGVAGNTYDFATMQGMYKAVRDIVQALGGSVTNYPTFN